MAALIILGCFGIRIFKIWGYFLGTLRYFLGRLKDFWVHLLDIFWVREIFLKVHIDIFLATLRYFLRTLRYFLGTLIRYLYT